MFGSNRGRFRATVDAIFAAALLVVCLGFAYSLGVQNTYYSKRASDYSEHYASDSENRILNECSTLEPVALQQCVKEIVEAAREQQRSEYDLSAQEAMAEWAFWMLVTSAGGFFVGALGVVFVARTLYETRKAVQAANDAVTVTREIGRDQSRAYAQVQRAEFFYDTAKETPKFKLVITNSGMTPAKWCAFKSTAFLDERQAHEMKFCDIAIDGDFVRWSGLAAGSQHNPTFYERRLNEDFAKSGNDTGGKRIFLVGIFQYKTFYEEIFETEFLFSLDGSTADILNGKTHQMIFGKPALQTYRQVQ